MQRDAEWFAKRAGKFTGSRFAELMAKTKSGPSASRANLIVRLAVERILGTCVDTYQNAAMLRGIEMEAEALAAYESYAGVLVEAVDFLEGPLPFVGCSPDGLVGDDGMVEAKCPTAEAKHFEALRSGAHATEYRWQLQGNLWVGKRQWIDAASYDPRFPAHLQLAVTRVERDESAIQELEAACIKADAEVTAIVEWMNERKAA